MRPDSAVLLLSAIFWGFLSQIRHSTRSKLPKIGSCSCLNKAQQFDNRDWNKPPTSQETQAIPNTLETRLVPKYNSKYLEWNIGYSFFYHQNCLNLRKRVVRDGLHSSVTIIQFTWLLRCGTRTCQIWCTYSQGFVSFWLSNETSLWTRWPVQIYQRIVQQPN